MRRGGFFFILGRFSAIIKYIFKGNFMGCACKNKAKQIEKISEGYNTPEEKHGIFYKILKFILQLGFGVLASAIIIVLIVPILLYVFICLMLGKQVNFNLKNFRKKKKN